MAINRRRFLGRMWKGLIGILGLEAGWTTWEFLRPRVSQGFGATIPAGTPKQVAEGEVRYFGDGRFYLSRVDGELHALYQKCPHLGCKVPFCETSNRFECPCHGSVFDRRGGYVAGPAPRGMDSFPVRVEEEVVLVDTGKVVPGPPRGRPTLTEEPAPSCHNEGAHGAPGSD